MVDIFTLGLITCEFTAIDGIGILTIFLFWRANAGGSWKCDTPLPPQKCPLKAIYTLISLDPVCFHSCHLKYLFPEGWHTCHGTHVEVREQLIEFGSLHSVGPRDQTQVFTLGSKRFYQLNHLDSLRSVFKAHRWLEEKNQELRCVPFTAPESSEITQLLGGGWKLPGGQAICW